MRQIISGKIKTVYQSQRIISMRVKNRIQFFYFQRGLMNKFDKYLVPGRFISFMITGEERIYQMKKVYQVDYIVKIIFQRYRKHNIYYDIGVIKKGTTDLINNVTNKLFLDFEMSMHPFKPDNTFVQEIIQCGMVLEDEDNNIVKKVNTFVRPTIYKKITDRTKKFLKITQRDIDSGIPYNKFYKMLKRIINEYDPTIIVWGRNDIITLNDSYNINKVKNITPRSKFINLLKIHKNYFNLKNDLGLFNAYRLYGNEIGEQAHNALEDALITREVFTNFKEVCNNKKKVTFKK